MISVAEANVISTVPHIRSLTAKPRIYRLVVDRRFEFLYAAIQTRLFPMMHTMHNAIQTLASVMTTGKLRLGSSEFNIAPSEKEKKFKSK